MSVSAGSTAIHRRVEALREGRDSTFIAKMPSGWAVFGERQFLRGYALLLPDPVVPTLNDLTPPTRDLFLSDMGRLGDALLAATGALRINYAMFGNLEPTLHAHVIPRYRGEPSPLDVAHPWAYDWNAAPMFDVGHESALLEAVRASLASSTHQSSRA